MRGFELTLKLSPQDSPGKVQMQDRSDQETIRISADGFDLVARRTPEVRVFQIGENNAEASRSLLLVCGHVVFEGRECSSEADAATFLASWKMNPHKTLNRLDGSFLVVMLEAGTGLASVVSDPFGSRPFWFSETTDGMHFGTNPAHVARKCGLPLEPDPAWTWSMLHFRRSVGERSPVKDVAGLPSGSILKYGQGKANVETWYDYTYAPAYEKNKEYFGKRFLELVRGHVECTCAESGKVALLLSGGLDSRLLAACCPKSVSGITLCDARNREVELAGRIADAAGLSHQTIIRPEYWYPELLEDSCRISGGAWLWDQAHFLPLGDMPFAYDATLVGYGSDSFFKGKDLDHPELWHANAEKGDMVGRARALLEAQPPKVGNAVELLDPDYAAVCREAFFGESMRVLENEVKYCTILPDLWQQFWGRNLARATALMNLVSLRGFTRERNVFTTVGMRRFHQTVPASLRRSGRLPVLALRAGGFSDLLAIPDANTWLPYTVPHILHKASAQARRSIASARKKTRATQQNTDYKSRGSWPRNGRLWLHSTQMSNLMDEFVGGDVFEGRFFNRSALRRCWTEHIEGTGDHSAALDFMATYGCVFRGHEGESKGMLTDGE